MIPLRAVRVGDVLVIAPRRERGDPGGDLGGDAGGDPGGDAPGPWIELAPGIEGRESHGFGWAALGWDPEAPAEGLAALSLYEQGEYLARVPPGARWDKALDGVVVPVSPDLGDAGLFAVAFRGHAGSAWLAAWRDGVPLFRVPVEVRTRKIDYLADYRAMLDDLARVQFGALLAPGAPTAVPVGPRGAPRARSPWEEFLLLRHLVREGVLARALDAIRRDPVAHLRVARRVVPTEHATRVRPEDVAMRALPRALRQPQGQGTRLPETVPEGVPAPTLDTPENRFVNHVLEALAARAAALAGAPGVAPGGEAMADAAAALAGHFAALRATSALAGVGGLAGAAPVGSAALQRRQGYREVLGAWLLVMDGGVGNAWAAADPLREGVRDTAVLYERWCTLEVGRALGVAEEDLARALAAAGVVRVGTAAGDVAIEAQRTFARGRGSYTLAFRPDLTLAAGSRRLHLDAKYQLERASDAVGEGDDGPYPRAGLLKMHAYRDAIGGTWGAFVLYPGAEAEGTSFLAADGGGVGALPLRPGADGATRDRQRAGLRALVARFVGGGG